MDIKEELRQIILKNRPKLATSSLTMYTSTLSSLMKKCSLKK
jgi:hypothetical protein